jgi:hypothetical protein
MKGPRLLQSAALIKMSVGTADKARAVDLGPRDGEKNEGVDARAAAATIALLVEIFAVSRTPFCIAQS